LKTQIIHSISHSLKAHHHQQQDLSSEELTSECSHSKSHIKLHMKSLIEPKHCEAAVKEEEEYTNIHKI
jgi:hypothetical protein